MAVLLQWKRAEKASDTDIGRGTEGAPFASLSKGAIYFFSCLLQNQRNVSRL